MAVTKKRQRDSFAKYIAEWEGGIVPIGMSRVTRNGYGGWYCRFNEAGEHYQKWFGDKTYGGEFSSYLAACKWLREARREAHSWWKTQVRA